MKTTPHPTNPTLVLAPFNLDAAKAGVAICTPLSGARRYIATSSNGNLIVTESEDGVALYTNISGELRLLLPKPPEGYELLEAGESGGTKLWLEGLSEWADCGGGHPQFAAHDGTVRIYARKLAVAEQPVTDSTGANVFAYSQGDTESARCLRDFGATWCKEGRSWHEFKRGFECAMRYAKEQRYPEPANDGWIEHHGGDCPVPDETMVESQYIDGSLGEHRADQKTWRDIVRYRVVPSENPPVPLIPPQLTLADVRREIAEAFLRVIGKWEGGAK